jgi:hypothetical protein
VCVCARARVRVRVRVRVRACVCVCVYQASHKRPAEIWVPGLSLSPATVGETRIRGPAVRPRGRELLARMSAMRAVSGVWCSRVVKGDARAGLAALAVRNNGTRGGAGRFGALGDR